MATKYAINVYSEIGNLKTVLLHRPGDELANLSPDLLERLLFDDTPDLVVAQQEHDAFAKTLKDNGVEVLYIEKLTEETITEHPHLREELLTKFLAESGTNKEYLEELKKYLQELSNKDLVNKMIAGVTKHELGVPVKLGMHFVGCAPKDLWPNEKLLKECQAIAKENGGSVVMTDDPKTVAIASAPIATDVWVSMGEDPAVWGQRIKDLTPYQVTMDKIKQGKEDVIFLHCLPSFHDDKTDTAKDVIKQFGGTGKLEVTDEVFNSRYSHVFEEAENRLHTIKAVMLATIRG